MEEIYKADKEATDKVEIYSRENNDLLGDIPHWLIYTGSYIIYGLIALLILGSVFFSYPNTVETGISIDDRGKTEWITATGSGVIDRFFVEDRQRVKRNDTLGMLRNTASLDDVKEFCRVLTKVEEYYRTNNSDCLKAFPFDLIMGEMTGAYTQFTEAVRTCRFYDEFDVFQQKVTFLQKELEILERDTLRNEMNILNARRQLFDLQIEHRRELAQNRKGLELAYENMVNSLKAWEARYLIRSRSAGIVVLGKSWGISNVVSEGDTVCSVITEQTGLPVGHVRLSQDQVAEIAVGNRVNIELSKYPIHTYGYLTGKVASVTYVPSTKNYAVDIGFPDGLLTTNRNEIAYDVGLTGKAEIITSDRSILSRIFTPVMELFANKS
ncbi:MAG: HlyD family secretion protein [Prevotellaceae bacterium]|jgi:hypothetical protein|nr:HlyD family secretion protein [Prevotellaceae bacterium]